MADKKISQLTTNPGIDGTEEMPTARSGSNFKNTLDALKTWLASVIGSLQAVTGIGNETTHNIGVKVGDNTGDAKTTVTPTGVVGQYKDDALPFAEISTSGINVGTGVANKFSVDAATGAITQNEDTIVVTKHAKVSIDNAALKTANSIPILLIADPGAGKIVRVTDVVGAFVFGSEALDASWGVIFTETVSDPATQYQWEIPFILSASADAIGSGTATESDRTGPANLIENKAVYFAADGDSTHGVGNLLNLYITYQIITL